MLCFLSGFQKPRFNPDYECDQWIHGRCSKLKKVIPSAARFFVCSKCDKATNGAGEVQQVKGDV